jgi:hypothetical protein
MKTTKTSISDTMAPAWQRIADTPLHRHVLDWIEDRADESQDDDTPAIDAIAGVLRDLAYGGCSSGMVGHLIYYADIATFWDEFGKECAQIVSENAEDCGVPIGDMFRADAWDKSDPLALEDTNRGLICWAGFEEAAYRIGTALGIEL